MFSLIRTILSNLTRRPATRAYPFFKRKPIEGYRGTLMHDPTTCIYCSLCAKRCPANALAVSRDPKSWTLDPYRCILCGYCVEVCPKKCLHMDPNHGNHGDYA